MEYIIMSNFSGDNGNSDNKQLANEKQDNSKLTTYEEDLEQLVKLQKENELRQDNKKVLSKEEQQAEQKQINDLFAQAKTKLIMTILITYTVRMIHS
jgi:hypothetical protein